MTPLLNVHHVEASGIERRVRLVLRAAGPLPLDELVMRLDLGWAPVFLAVDRLTRCGHVSLRPAPHGGYVVAGDGPSAGRWIEPAHE